MILSLAFVPPEPAIRELGAALDLRAIPMRQLDFLHPSALHMSVTAFGNVAQGEVPRIAQTVRRISAGWPAPAETRFTGGAALEWEGDTQIWARTEGGEDTMQTVASSIPGAVRAIGFAVDRRRFHPWVPVARINASTQAPALEALHAQLEAYAGPTWSVDRLSLLRTTHDDRAGMTTFSVVEEFRLPG